MSRSRCHVRLGQRTRINTSPRARSGMRTTVASGTVTPPPVGGDILLEDGTSFILLENTNKIALES